MKKIIGLIYFIFSSLLLLYLVYPINITGIGDVADLPDSVKSKLSGDTVEVPSIKAFFSNNYRQFVTGFYLNDFREKSIPIIPPLRLNYPPEEAFTYIKNQTQSTYLEEYTYPLRNSLFVNGLEPFDEISKSPRYAASTHFIQDDMPYETKVTLRYYSSPLLARIFVWFGITSVFYLLYRLTINIFSSNTKVGKEKNIQ